VCQQLHIVNPATGRLLSEEEEEEHRNTIAFCKLGAREKSEVADWQLESAPTER
jgi:hypothetical protein